MECPKLSSLLFLFLLIGIISGRSATSNTRYLDPDQPLGTRVDDLLGRMTLEEKVGQINMPCVYVDDLGERLSNCISKMSLQRLKRR